MAGGWFGRRGTGPPADAGDGARAGAATGGGPADGAPAAATPVVAAAPPAAAAAPAAADHEQRQPVTRVATPWPNLPSFLLFSWFTPLLTTGWRRPLGLPDLPHLLLPLTTDASADAFIAAFQARAPSPEAMKAAAAEAALKGTGEESWPGGGGGKKKKKKKAARPADEAGRAAAAAAAAAAGKSGAPLIGALWQLNRGRLLGSMGLQLAQAGIQFAGPMLLKLIATVLNSPTPPTRADLARAYTAAGFMFLAPLLGALGFVHASRLAATAQVRVRAQLTAAVYRKALRLSPRSRQRVEVGRVVNMMSSDVNTLATFVFPFFNQLFSAPIMLAVALALLWVQIRWGTFIGLAILLLSSPASGRFVRKITQLRRAMLTHTDARVRLTNQLLAGIRVLKLYAWEAAQEAAVLEARRLELGRLRAAIPFRVGMQTLLFSAPALGAVASFAAYGSAEPQRFMPPRIFAALALFSLMRLPLILLPFTLVELGNGVVSARRLTQFLTMEERDGGDGRGLEPPTWPGGLGIQIQGADFYWPEPGPPVGAAGPAKAGPPPSTAASDKKKKKGKAGGTAASSDGGSSAVAVDVSKAGPPPPSEGGGSSAAPPKKDAPEPGSLAALRASVASTRGGGGAPPDFDPLAAGGPATYWLRSIDLAVKPGDLVCVVGRVGSGKSSLISAALGEMCVAGGCVRLGGSVAYAAQQAFIANATLRDNVLFGRGFEPARWEATLDACCLRPDLAVLAAGDQTEIGEKGINLSGGQKQRVAIARALYSGADTFLLDDVLSAVDVHVGATLWSEAIVGGMVRGRSNGGAPGAVLIATNQLQYLSRPETSAVVYLENGRIAACGKFEAVRASSPGFRALLEDFEARQAAAEKGEAGPSPSPPAAKRGPSLDLTGTDLAALRAASRGASLDLTAVKRAGAGAAPGSPPPPVPPPSQRPAALTSSAAARAARFQRVPTVAIEREARLEALHDAEAGGRGAVGARGGTAVPALESAFARTYARPGTAGDGSGSRSGAATPVGGAPAGAGGGLVATAARSASAALGALWRPAARRPPRSTASAPPPPPSSVPSDDSAAGVGGGAKAAPSSPPSSPPPPGKAGAERDEAAQKKKGAITVAEDRETGAIGGAVYAYYVSKYGLVRACLLVAFWTGEQSCRVLTNWWLARWTAAEAAALKIPGPHASPRAKYLGGYVGLSLGFVALTCMRATVNLLSAVRASKAIHAEALHAVVRSPVSFFDATPIGRALNRFSKDTDELDYLLPQSLGEFFNCLFQLAATIIFISIIQPWFLAGVFPLMGFYYLVQRFYRRANIELQRTDATTRSPIYAHFSETLSGTDTLRAYGAAPGEAAKSARLVDTNHRAFFSLKSADQWLSLRLELVGAGLVALTAVLGISGRGRIPPALAALALSESLDVVGFLKYAVMSGAMFEARSNAVERLMTYARLPSEAAVDTPPGAAPPPDWPTAGALAFQDVSLRYRPELDPALRGVTFSLPAGCRAGVVGRTGSGKSSLVQALFRIVEPCGGRITVDGVDLATLGLADVRGRISVIPQDPALFSGTVRSNLDPYGRHADGELWNALDVVGLRAIVAEAGAAEAASDAGVSASKGATTPATPTIPLRSGLDARVTEGGDNWSVGQRQLLCVARAVLRRPRLLVADEATASVDGETDAAIQAALRSAFAGATTLTVAHRLNTILDSDRVLVMEKGVVAEDGSVPELLAKEGGMFRAMVEGAE